jgi:cytochrome b subunit of formate dehydrogenase
MTPIITLVSAFMLTAAPAAAAEKPALSTEAKACLDCHSKEAGMGPEFNPEPFLSSVHAANGVDCTACHQGYTDGPHEQPPLEDPEQAKIVERIAKAKTPAGEAKSTSPRVWLSCGECHDALEQLKGSVHGTWLTTDSPKVAGPTCVSCHGSIHELKGVDERGTADARTRADRCSACHEDPALTTLAGLPPDVPLSYRDSIHGRLVAVGSARAPDCFDCHGSHQIVSKTNPLSSVAGENRVQTCGKCHEDSNENFASLISHTPLHKKGVFPHFIHVMFSWLTAGTLIFFALHVLIDFQFELRKRLQRWRHPHVDPDARRSVLRFDIHQRIQHWLMLSGVILLAITGWPLRGAGEPAAVPSSKAFLELFGGAHGAALVHRFGAVLIIASSIYHLVYLAGLAKKRILPLSMVPNLKDAMDIKDNMAYMLGVSKKKPQFDRFNYLEKFDYWAVFWGIVMMVGTGFIYWFPTTFGIVLPTWALAAAQIIHGEEATLATLFLFVVHFYNVHLKPSIFPMNWAWLTGQTSVEFMKDEHPAEYEREFGGSRD